MFDLLFTLAFNEKFGLCCSADKSLLAAKMKNGHHFGTPPPCERALKPAVTEEECDKKKRISDIYLQLNMCRDG